MKDFLSISVWIDISNSSEHIQGWLCVQASSKCIYIYEAMQSSEQQHAVDTMMMLNLWMMWLRHREIGLFMRPQRTPGNVAFESTHARQTSLEVPVSSSSLQSSACSLPAQPGLNGWDHTQALFSLSISLAALHQCLRGWGFSHFSPWWSFSASLLGIPTHSKC